MSCDGWEGHRSVCREFQDRERDASSQGGIGAGACGLARRIGSGGWGKGRKPDERVRTGSWLWQEAGNLPRHNRSLSRKHHFAFALVPRVLAKTNLRRRRTARVTWTSLALTARALVYESCVSQNLLSSNGDALCPAPCKLHLINFGEQTPFVISSCQYAQCATVASTSVLPRVSPGPIQQRQRLAASLRTIRLNGTRRAALGCNNDYIPLCSDTVIVTPASYETWGLFFSRGLKDCKAQI